MEEKEKFKKLRQAERELLTATPKQAARLAKKIVKWKAEMFG